MRAKFLSVEAKPFTNPNTGEKGTDHVLTLLVGEAVRMVRVPVEFYRAHQGIPAMSDVEIKFGFAEGRFGRHFPTIEALNVLAAVK